MASDGYERQRSTARRAPAETPPRLRLHLRHHLSLLLVLNILPITGALYVWWEWRAGRVTLRTMDEASRTTLVIVLLSGVAFAVIVWFIMPLARWLRDYPAWHLRRGPAWAWIIPTCSGWLAWAALTLAGALAAAAAVLVAGLGLWHLFKAAGSP